MLLGEYMLAYRQRSRRVVVAAADTIEAVMPVIVVSYALLQTRTVSVPTTYNCIKIA